MDHLFIAGVALIGPLDILAPADQEEHVKAWRWYWFTKGVVIKKVRDY